MKDNYKKTKKLESRKDLINFFSKGSLPNEEHFEKLINSNFNRVDDNLDINENGLMLYPANEGKFVSFYKRSDDEFPKYGISISENGMVLKQGCKSIEEEESKNKSPDIFIEENTGKIGIGKNSPKQQLDVAGLIGSKGRIGNIEGELPADGQWHNVFSKENLYENKENLYGVNAFEIMAYARGVVKQGRYSLLHAIGTCVYGRSKISKTCSHYGRNNRIEVRWVARNSQIQLGIDEEREKLEKQSLFTKIKRWFSLIRERKEKYYNLQLRTKSHYRLNPSDENDVKLFYNLSILWNSKFKPRTNEIQYDNNNKKEPIIPQKKGDEPFKKAMTKIIQANERLEKLREELREEEAKVYRETKKELENEEQKK